MASDSRRRTVRFVPMRSWSASENCSANWRLTQPLRVASVACAFAVFTAERAAGDESADIRAARSAYDEAVAQSKRGDTEAALASFERAYRLGGHPAALFNTGQLQYSLGFPVQAIQSLERYLSAVSGNEDEERLRLAEQTLQRLRRRVGTIRVEVDPPDSQVAVDGMVLDTSRQSTHLLVGLHSLVVSREGFQTENRVVDVISGERATVRVQLRATPVPVGWIQVSCAVPDVSMRIGDTVVHGDGMTQPVTVPAGYHLVRFDRAGYISASTDVLVKMGQPTHVDCAMRIASDLARVDQGRLTIRALPEDAEVIVDGALWNRREIPVGLHRVEVRRSGYKSWQNQVRVPSRHEVSLDVELVPTALAQARLDAQARRQRVWAGSVGATGLALDVAALVVFLWNSKRHEDWEQDRDRISQGERSHSAWPMLAERSASIQRADDIALASAVVGTALLSASVYYLLRGPDHAAVGAPGSRLGISRVGAW